MAKTNRQYWIDRARHRELISYTNNTDVTAALLGEYKKCAAKIRREINDFYNRYANDYGITYDEAVREMSRAELQEWRAAVGDYIEQIRGEKNPQIRERLMREYDARYYNSRISRLEGLCGNIQMEVDTLSSRAVGQLSDFLGEEYEGSYYRALYDIQTLRGYGDSFSTINAEIVERTLAYPWSGANFSDRIWQNKTALVNSIRETLTQGMIRGDSLREMAKAVAEKLDGSYKNALRLVRTESAHIHNTAELDAYKECGFEQFEFVAGLGERTCEVCGSLDGKRFKLSDKQFGVNFPPLHPNCRCTTIAVDPDDDLEDLKQLEGNQALNYEQWYKKYVNGKAQPKLESKDGAAIELESKGPAPVLPSGEEKGAKTLTGDGNGGIIFTDKQRGKKIGEHARQWGLDPSKTSDREKLEAVINDIFQYPDEVRVGPYRSQPDEVKFFIKGEDVVVTKQNNEFITILKGGVNSVRVKNARRQNI